MNVASSGRTPLSSTGITPLLRCRVGRGRRAGCSATSARPSDLPVQFSRRQLSPGEPLLAVVALHARDQLQEVDQSEFPVELCLRQLSRPTATLPFAAPAPAAQQKPAI